MSAPQVLERIGLGGRCVTLRLSGGRIAAIEPAPPGTTPRWQALPLLADPHLHLDKTFTFARARPRAPGLFAAIDAAGADARNWTAADLRTRAARALTESAAAGMGALRSHVDWPAPAPPTAWSVLAELAAEWRGRLTVQRAALCPLDLLGDRDHGPGIARAVAQTGDGVLGAFVYRNADLPAKLARVFALAADHGLALDFHVDEGVEPEASGFDAIVEQTARHGMGGRVLCGHGCALAVRPEPEVARVLHAAARAGVGLTVLPGTNLWLQDGAPGRTPRLRGLAPLVEARAAGVTVMLGADNVADPFQPLGAYDPVETLRLAVPAAHLDPEAWVDAITTTPAHWLGAEAAPLAPGAPAGFVLLEGASLHDALRRPPRRRIFRAGVESGPAIMETS